MKRHSNESSSTCRSTLNIPTLPTNALVCIFDTSCDDHDVRQVLRLARVCKAWRRIIWSHDDTLVRRVVQGKNRFIQPEPEDFNPDLRRVESAGAWLNAGLRYLLVCQTLGPKHPAVVKDSHLKAPGLDKIPYMFGPVEEVHAQNGREIPGLDGGDHLHAKGKIYLRHYMPGTGSGCVDSCCILDVDNRKFEYVDLDEAAFKIYQFPDGQGLEARLVRPGVYESDTKTWRIPSRCIGTNNDDEKLRLMMPRRNEELHVIRENCRDEILYIAKVNHEGIVWELERQFPVNTQVVTRSGLGIVLLITHDTIHVYDSKTGKELAEKPHMIRLPELDQDESPVRLQEMSADWRLTDTHLLHFYKLDRQLYACPLEQLFIRKNEGLEWCNVLNIDTTWLGVTEAELWHTVNIDNTSRFVMLSCNQLTGVGFVVLDLFSGVIKSYALDLEDLDMVRAAKYQQAQRLATAMSHRAPSMRNSRRRLANCHDGMWVVDQRGEAIYISTTRLTMVKNVYCKYGFTGPQELTTLGPWIEAIPCEPKLGFWGKARKRLDKKPLRVWK